MQLPSLTTIIITVVVILITRFISKYLLIPYIKMRRYKGFKGGSFVYTPVLGDFAKMQADLKTHDDLYYSAVKRIIANPNLRALFYPMFNGLRIDLYDSELIKEFFIKQSKFVKEPVFLGPMLQLIPGGLVVAEGEKWKSQRKLISQVFHYDYINACIPIINRKGQEWIENYIVKEESKEIPSTSIIDVKKAMKMYTSRVIWRTFFGEEDIVSGAESEKFLELILHNVGEIAQQSFSVFNVFFGPGFFQLGLRAEDRKSNQETKIVLEFARKKLNDFREKLSKENESLSSSNHTRNLIELLLIEASKHPVPEESLSDSELISQIVTFLLAGTDTTLNLIVMMHYFLALYPQVQEKLREEIMQHIGKTGEITYEKLSKLDYLTAVMKETLRMYGPADTIFPRVATEDIMIGDLLVHKGDIVTPVIRIVGSNPKYFSNPEEFRPERWIEKTDPGVNDPFAFTPFSAGPRRCIGEQLAYVEAKSMIVELVRRYHIDIKRPFKLRMDYGLAYENKEPMLAIYTKL